MHRIRPTIFAVAAKPRSHNLIDARVCPLSRPTQRVKTPLALDIYAYNVVTGYPGAENRPPLPQTEQMAMEYSTHV